MPRTSCRYSISGKPIAVAVNDIVEMAKFEIEKLRSREQLSGTSGSLAVARLPPRRTGQRTTSPAMIRPHTEIGPLMVPQSYWWPSWMPNTSANMPRPLSATPSQSNVWRVRRQVRHQAPGQHEADDADRDVDEEDPLPAERVDEDAAEDRARPASRHRRSRPTAPSPGRARSAGKIRVITAIVCGVISAAPRPCTTRATISISIVDVSPHHSEARVKTVRPTR